MDARKNALLRRLPAVDAVLEQMKKDPELATVPLKIRTKAARLAIEAERSTLLRSDAAEDEMERRISHFARETALEAMAPSLRRVVNATGVIVHTNLGRSLLHDEVMTHVRDISLGYTNLEFDLSVGKRGSRYTHVEDIICEISGAEAALVVNNNAGAVFLALETLAKDREVIVSRGELVEIGGSFRVPDVMAKSGGILREVGTTNRTHLPDYEKAIGDGTALLLKVHRSNFEIVGFTTEVSLAELVALGRRTGLPVMEDLGSGNFIDFTRYGLRREPMVQDSVASGADLVTFSGDKLLGGPQAGIIVGRKAIVERIKRNPLNRALRIDKMTLAALEATMRLFLEPEKAVEKIPTLRMLTLSLAETEQRAARLVEKLQALADDRLGIERLTLSSRAGGGALPTMELPSRCVGIRVEGLAAHELETALRRHRPPIIGRIEEDRVLLDTRTIQDGEDDIISHAVETLLKRRT